MCLIVLKPEGADFDPKLLRAAYDHNPHGFGIMYAKDGRVHHEKGLLQFEDALALWEKYREHQTAVHFRYTTRGKTTEENCHPFQILNFEEHGRDLFMMHNGTLANVQSGDQSDTFNFAKLYLTPLLSKRVDILKEQEFQDFLTMTVGNNNRLLFMDGDGEVVIINKDKGEVMTDCWLSNTYSLQPRRTYPNQHHNRANYQGYYARHIGATAHHAATSRPGVSSVPANGTAPASAWTPTAASALKREAGETNRVQEWDDELELFFPSRSPRRQARGQTLIAEAIGPAFPGNVKQGAGVGDIEIFGPSVARDANSTTNIGGTDNGVHDVDLGMVKQIGYNVDVGA
jgi:predicted glutamine amidotransferase